MRTFFKIISLIAGSFMSVNTYALCTASDVNVNFDQSILIQRDVPVGSVLGSVTVNHPINCDAKGQTTAEGSWAIQLAPTNIDNGASVIAGVRATNVEGIGLRWKNYSSTTGATGTVTNGSLNLSTWQRGISQKGATFNDTFELVKTASTPRTGIISPLVIAIQYSTPVSKNVQRQPLFKYLISGVNTNTVSCLVQDSNLNIDMGFAVASKFNGIGSTQNPVNFNVSLNCDAQTSVNVTLDNVSVLADATNGVLGLSSASTASGVGIQILHQDSPVKFGSMINHAITTSNGEIVNIPFKAAYYQTDKNIQPGTINATASFTMTYR
ncbi:fimbrial protein [Enterobacter sp. GD03975]|uniref:fimbrial protein n=1 Tax=Enterobacter sp. GD03975 TaxID=2975412 RepID=UPI0024478CA1|nr:fimbrial protein [Enterobacter sp. GD03975]MDH1125453.1 type 1 fimbrial protein [Enterobacter sp. GD03975]